MWNMLLCSFHIQVSKFQEAENEHLTERLTTKTVHSIKKEKTKDSPLASKVMHKYNSLQILSASQAKQVYCRK